MTESKRVCFQKLLDEFNNRPFFVERAFISCGTCQMRKEKVHRGSRISARRFEFDEL